MIVMHIADNYTIDMVSLVSNAYELGDLINGSTEVSDYLYWKQQVEQNESIQQLTRLFEKKKEMFEECQRFGHFHPEYHKAKDAVKEVEQRLAEFEEVRRFKMAEQVLDKLLHGVSETIAYAVSESIKVPSNDPNPKGGGCGSGGGCSGNCG